MFEAVADRPLLHHPLRRRGGAKGLIDVLRQINVYIGMINLPIYVYVGFVPNTHDHSRHHHSIRHLHHPPIQRIHP